MAVITEMPGEKVIAGWKKILDFYYWMGIPCVRKWPSSPGHNRSPGVQSTWQAFTYASREWSNLSPEVQDAYKEMAGRGGLCGRDCFLRGYLKGLYRNPLEPTP